MNAAPMSPLYRKIAWRLVPFLMLLYMVAFLDRVNISFAALTMNRDLGISESVYGFAAGVFFLSYCLFEVPANLVLARLGARRWLAILMVIWGIISMATAFVHSEATYIGARFLLGIAESGFYPGRHLLLHFLVAPNLADANPGHLSARCSTVQFDWFAHLRTYPPTEQSFRAAWLAVALSDGGRAGRDPRRRRLVPAR